MSGRGSFGKPVVAAAGCAVLGAAAMIGYAAFGGQETSPSTAANSSGAARCIALAIDRATGTTSAVPCAGTQTLLAEQSGRSK